MIKVILIFLKNKILEILEFLGKASLVISVLALIFGVLWGLGYLVTLGLGGYSWYWELMMEDNVPITNVFEMGVNGFGFILFSIIMLGVLGFVGFILLYLLPTWFVKWIRDNWRKAKREANYKN